MLGTEEHYALTRHLVGASNEHHIKHFMASDLRNAIIAYATLHHANLCSRQRICAFRDAVEVVAGIGSEELLHFGSDEDLRTVIFSWSLAHFS